jgi:hypothetical protein
MSTFNKVAKELNKNLEILAKAKEMQIGPTRFQEYLQASSTEAIFETKRVDPNEVVKKAMKNKGFNIGFCTYCIDGECSPAEKVNNWTATGCRCCQLSHTLV